MTKGSSGSWAGGRSVTSRASAERRPGACVRPETFRSRCRSRPVASPGASAISPAGTRAVGRHRNPSRRPDRSGRRRPGLLRTASLRSQSQSRTRQRHRKGAGRSRAPGVGAGRSSRRASLASTSSARGLVRASARAKRPDTGFGTGVSPDADHVADAPGRRAEHLFAGGRQNADVAGERRVSVKESEAGAVQIELAQLARRGFALAVFDDALFGASATRENAAIRSGDGKTHSRYLVPGAKGPFKRRR